MLAALAMLAMLAMLAALAMLAGLGESQLLAVLARPSWLGDECCSDAWSTSFAVFYLFNFFDKHKKGPPCHDFLFTIIHVN